MSNFLAGFLSGFAPQYIDGLKRKQQEEKDKALREWLANTYNKRNQANPVPAAGQRAGGIGDPNPAPVPPGRTPEGAPEGAPAAAPEALNQLFLNPNGTKFNPYVFNTDLLPQKKLPFNWFGPI